MKAAAEGLSIKLADLHLVLASTSPRRVELLKAAGYDFQVVPPDVEESSSIHLTPRELSLLNAKRKAHAVAAFMPTSLVIGADTVVAIAGETLGKPADLAHARRMLQMLSGKTHEVITSVWLTRLHPFRIIVFSEVSYVTFRDLDANSLHAYLGKINPLDKAGAYAAQEFADEIILRIEGSTTNVIGLPMERLGEELAGFAG